MTIHLRDRMAEELDVLGALGADLVPDAVGTGRRRRRLRHVLQGTAAVAVVAAAATALSGLTGPGTAGPAGPTGAGEVRADWADAVSDLFAAHLPAGFDAVTRDDGPALQFLADGPDGTVKLNAEVYVDSSIDLPTCSMTGAEECREVALGDGAEATVLANVYTNRPDLPQASQVWVSRPDGVQAIVNAVATEPGEAPFWIDDLVDLATSEELSDVIDLGAEQPGYLEGYGVNRPSR